MPSFYDDNEDLRWYVDKGIDWEPLVAITEYDWSAGDGPEDLDSALESYRDVLGLFGQFAAETIAPRAAEIDRHKPELVDGEVVPCEAMSEIFEAFGELEVYGMCLPRELGGMNLPVALYMMSVELVARADVSVVAHYGFHGGIASALLLYSVLEGSSEFDTAQSAITSTRFADAIDEIRRGEAWGSMDITEPDAGSDMGSIRCTGEVNDDGDWFVSGSKIFITSGHGRHHVVIARTEAAASDDDPSAGLGGLSLFLVPAWSGEGDSRVRHATIDTLEDKLGHTGSATVALTFDHAPAELIGKRGEGFKQMLLLMNNARIGVGFESLGLCEAAWRLARDYAATRSSMGKTIDRHELIAEMLEEMRTDIQGIRALTMSAAIHEELNQKLAMKLRFFPPSDRDEVDFLRREQLRHKAAARRLTPLVKYIASERAVQMARQCIQIHGGYGYIKEYGAEKLLRDAMVMPIYEGTSQIQALMATKDTLLAAIRKPQEFVRNIASTRWRSLNPRDPLDGRVARLHSLSLAAQQHLISRIVGHKLGDLRSAPFGSWSTVMSEWDPKTDFGPALLHADRLIQLLTDVTIGEILSEQSREHPERAEVLERWLEVAEPRCRYLHDRITSTGDRLLSSLEESEA